MSKRDEVARYLCHKMMVDDWRQGKAGYRAHADAISTVYADPDDRMVSALVDVLTEHGCGPVSDETAKAAIRAAMQAAGE